MKSKIKKNEFKPDLIITADWHLMEKERIPPCRVDDYWETQWEKVKEILSLQDTYECPILIAGDFFEHWKTSPRLLNHCIKILKGRDIYSIIGNHDMPQHNIDLMDKSGLNTLFTAGSIHYLKNHIDWEGKRKYKPLIIKGKKVLFVHMMVWEGEKPWPGCVDPEAGKALKLFPDIDLLVTGHNHKTIVKRKGERLLINPGSITRHKADQIKHQPCVFLWYSVDNSYKIHYLKIDKKAVSREHVEKKTEKDRRSKAFIESLKKDWGIGFSFEGNVERRLKENNISKSVKKLVYKWMDKKT